MTRGTVFQINASAGGVPKKPIAEARITAAGIAGDRQAKPGIHGGPYRALCLFPREEIDRLASIGHPVTPGSIGENITTLGLDWTAVVPNARLRIGNDVVIEVTGYADPCKTIAASFIDGNINLVNPRTASCSRVYARVCTEGIVRAGDAIAVESAGVAPTTFLAEAGVRMVSQVSLKVSDLERSAAFYRDCLGAELTRVVTDWGLAFLDVGGTSIMLEGPQHNAEPFVAGAVTVMFGVEDINGSFEAMSARGVAFDAPPLLQAEEDGVQFWMAFLRDPDGHRLGLVSRGPVSPTDP